MTVADLAGEASFRALCLPEADREISGVYIGDLLSWVMGRAGEGNLWLTIMTNLNVVAVASLANTSAVIFCEGCDPGAEVIGVAEAKGVNLIVSELSIYDTACRLSRLLS